MLSYVFQNGKIKREEIVERCNSVFNLNIISNSDDCMFLMNQLVTILIKKEFTHIVLKNENVSIQNIESLYGERDGKSKRKRYLKNTRKIWKC